MTSAATSTPRRSPRSSPSTKSIQRRNRRPSSSSAS
jgi:hypothetical protein